MIYLLRKHCEVRDHGIRKKVQTPVHKAYEHDKERFTQKLWGKGNSNLKHQCSIRKEQIKSEDVHEAVTALRKLLKGFP